MIPLNLNIDLRRLTQLFGRSLYIKYFIKHVEPVLLRKSHPSSQAPRQDDENYGACDVDELLDAAPNEDMIGFEDAQLADGGFAAADFENRVNPDNIVKTNLFKRFQTVQTLSRADEIKVDLMKIQKKIDVKKLKHQLWTFINPRIDPSKGVKESELSRPPVNKKTNAKTQIINGEYLNMSDVLGTLYLDDQVDPENVSIHSAFICLLHIANEKGLALISEED